MRIPAIIACFCIHTDNIHCFLKTMWLTCDQLIQWVEDKMLPGQLATTTQTSVTI